MTSTKNMKQTLRRTPLLGPAATSLSRFSRRHLFPGSEVYWEKRYASGGTSGHGSEGILAQFKSEVLNSLVSRNRVESVIEFGCGDGRQLQLAQYPRYMGLDVSETGVRQAMRRFADDDTKSFMTYNARHFCDPAGFLTADLTLSLDVIYHLVEDNVYTLHLNHLFGSARRFVALYTSDSDSFATNERIPPHVRHRPVKLDIAERFSGWRLRDQVSNPHPHTGGSGETTSFADFLIYEMISN